MDYNKVINNVCDMNDGGINNDASIVKFYQTKDSYFEVKNDFNEETKWLSGIE